MSLLPNANPSFTHCTVPAKFAISHRNKASLPSSTWRFVGCVRKCCLLAAIDLKAIAYTKTSERE